MKRFLSWVVLLFGNSVFAVLAALIVTGAYWLFGLIYDRVETLFWVLVVVEGLTFLGFSLMAVAYGAQIIVGCSQKVWRSKIGLRYILVGAFTALAYLSSWIILVLDLVYVRYPILVGAYYIVMLAFGIVLIFIGRDSVSNDGPPPTKRQILEEKLRKIEERERRYGSYS